MKKILAIQGSDLKRINIKTDTTILLAAEAQKRGYKIYFYEPQNMVSDLLDNEADLKYFCEENNLKSGNIYRFDFPSDLCHDNPGRSAVHRDLILI